MIQTGAQVLPFGNTEPKIPKNVFIATGACIIGDVEIGENSNIWFNTILRGDVNYIRVGKNTNIQDGTVCHVTTNKYPLIIGDNVTIGHSAILHGCAIHDECLVGMGAIVMDNAVVEKGSMVAAGAVVTPNKIVKSGEVWAGNPATKMRNIKPEEIEYLVWSAKHYVDLAGKYT